MQSCVRGGMINEISGTIANPGRIFQGFSLKGVIRVLKCDLCCHAMAVEYGILKLSNMA